MTMDTKNNPQDRKYNLYGRAEGSPVYPEWVLLGQFDTPEEREDLLARMGKNFDEFTQSDR